MRKINNLIHSVTIKYFRSINTVKIKNFSQVNIFTGGNDIGKSNLVRALKLFFDETNESGKPIDFTEEFSHSRLDVVRKDSVKGKQFIQIEVEFNCEGAFQKTLPKRFKVKKTWYRATKGPPNKTDNNLQTFIDNGSLKTSITRAEGSLQRFLGAIVFTCVPAIKDRSFFRLVLSDLQEVLFDQSKNTDAAFLEEIEKFNTDLGAQAAELRSEFNLQTGIETSISLPSSYGALFQAFDVKTKGEYGDAVSLDNRGDGIRVRFLPAILNYIAENSKKQHVWGFEEPENSMEYRRAFELSKTMSEVYSKNAQIFITTHSPAFIDLKKPKHSIFLARRKGADTDFLQINEAKKNDLDEIDPMLLLADELGHIALMDDLRQRMQERMDSADKAIAKKDALLNELSTLQTPVLLTEGRTDPKILEIAWEKLRNTPMPFVIKSCNVDTQNGNEAAGAGQLSICLRSILPDHPHLVIGLFDRDFDGLKAWKLDKNFVQSDLLSDLKSAKNGKAHGLVLPVPAHEPNFDKSETLTIEFLFPPEALSRKVDGRGLVLEPMTITQKLGAVDLEAKKGEEFWQQRVTGGKSHFCQHVVPTLPSEHFAAFGPIFIQVEKLIAKAGN